MALAEQARHHSHGLVDMGKKSFVPFAKMIQPCFTIRREVGAVLGTTAVAGKQHRTFTAIARQRGFFVQAEL
jgi:hypothetical protein